MGARQPRYEVKVEGGKGAVIGDFATVVQVFKEAPAATLVADPDAGVHRPDRGADAELRRPRVRVRGGRRGVRGSTDFPSGYIVIHGEPGIGKTAIVGQLVKDRALVHHFNVAPLGIRSPQAFLSNVCAQLIVRYGLDYTLAARGGDAGRRLPLAAARRGRRAIRRTSRSSSRSTRSTRPRTSASRRARTGSSCRRACPAASTSSSARGRRRSYRLFTDPRERHLPARRRPAEPRRTSGRTSGRTSQSNRERMQPRIEEWGVAEDEFVEVLTDEERGQLHVPRARAARHRGRRADSGERRRHPEPAAGPEELLPAPLERDAQR